MRDDRPERGRRAQPVGLHHSQLLAVGTPGDLAGASRQLLRGVRGEVVGRHDVEIEGAGADVRDQRHLLAVGRERAGEHALAADAESFVCSVPWPQFDACVENGTLLLKASRPKLAPLFLVPSTRIVWPSGAHADLSAEVPSRRAGAGRVERERPDRREAQLRAARAALDERDDVGAVRRRERRVRRWSPPAARRSAGTASRSCRWGCRARAGRSGSRRAECRRCSTRPPPAVPPVPAGTAPDGLPVVGLITLIVWPLS